MPTSFKQAAFVGGEIAPSLHARTDLPQYAVSLKTCRNFILRPAGGAMNRPGLKFANEVKVSADEARVIPFRFSGDEGYAIEIGDGYLRFHRDGATIMDSTTIPATHDGGADQAVLTDSGESWEAGRFVGGTVDNDTDGSQGRITANTGTTVTGVLYGGTENDWDNGDTATITIPYEVEAPWAKADIFRLKWAQVHDVMTLTHPDYPAYELRRFADDSWTLSAVVTAQPVNPPTAVTDGSTWGTPGETNYPGRDWDWVVTSVDADGNESVASSPLQLTDKALYQNYSECYITWTAPSSGNTPVLYNVYRGRNGVYGYVGSSDSAEFYDEGYGPDYSDAPPEARDPFISTELTGGQTQNSASYSGDTATKAGATDAYDDKYTMPYTVYLDGGEMVKLEFRTDPSGAPGEQTHATRVFRARQGEPEFHSGTVVVEREAMGAGGTFRIVITDSDGSPTVTRLPVTWVEGGEEIEHTDNPAAVCIFDQRRVFGGMSWNWQRIVTSRTGRYSNFDLSSPLKDDDSIDLTLAGKQANEIRALVDQGAILVFTQGAVWVLRGAEGTPLSPTSLDAKPRIHYGCSWIDPLPIGDATLWVPDRGKTVRQLLYDEESNQAKSRDLGIKAQHLFEANSIVDWDYADAPFNCVWAVRSDGRLLGLTFNEEHGIEAWHRHDTGHTKLELDTAPTDKFESVCVLPEGDEHRVYCVVRRTVDGSTRRYIEYFDTRFHTNIEDYVLMDSALSYDGTHTGSTTMTLSGGVTWLAGETGLTLTASAATFASGDVGKRIELRLDAISDAGTHTGADDADTLTDSTKSWTTGALIGGTVRNLRDGSEGTITANTGTTVSATLDGGWENKWDQNDAYEIAVPVKKYRVEITGYTDTTHVTVQLVHTIPSDLQGSAADEWAWAVKTFAALEHLEGRPVSILADGNAENIGTISSGAITLNVWSARTHIGLPYYSDLETLQLHVPGEPATFRDKRKQIIKVAVEVEATRAIKAGEDLSNMEEWGERDVDLSLEEPISPQTELCDMRFDHTWRQTAGLAIRNEEPLPVHIVAVIPSAATEGE